MEKIEKSNKDFNNKFKIIEKNLQTEIKNLKEKIENININNDEKINNIKTLIDDNTNKPTFDFSTLNTIFPKLEKIDVCFKK